MIIGTVYKKWNPQLVEAQSYKPEGRGFDSRLELLEFFIYLIISAAL
jgi:hypothetical protein